jgi:hypothetical protein
MFRAWIPVLCSLISITCVPPARAQGGAPSDLDTLEATAAVLSIYSELSSPLADLLNDKIAFVNAACAVVKNVVDGIEVREFEKIAAKDREEHQAYVAKIQTGIDQVAQVGWANRLRQQRLQAAVPVNQEITRYMDHEGAYEDISKYPPIELVMVGQMRLMEDIEIMDVPVPSPMTVLKKILISRGSLAYSADFVRLCMEKGENFLTYLDDDTLAVASEGRLREVEAELKKIKASRAVQTVQNRRAQPTAGNLF